MLRPLFTSILGYYVWMGGVIMTTMGMRPQQPRSSGVSRGELRLLALAAVNEELGKAIASLAEGGPVRLFGLGFHDRLRLKEMALENDLIERGIPVV